MTLLLASRILALALSAAAVIHAWPQGAYAFGVLFQCAFACVLIWFPQAVDDFTFGSTRSGHQIDSHTPAWMIATVGWVLLLLRVTFSMKPDAISRLFGM